MLNLEALIESKYEPEVYSFFLLAPPRAFYADEVATRLGFPKGKVEEVLLKMVEAGQMKLYTKKTKKYFLLKPDFKPFPELKQALLKDKLVYTDELFEAAPKLTGVKACFLSGLFTGKPELPVDILFVGKANPEQLTKFLAAVEKMMGQEVNYSIMPEEEFWVRRDTFDRFIKDIFDYPHLVVFDMLKKPKAKS